MIDNGININNKNHYDYDYYNNRKKQAVVSKFLVKFESESEAWRAVRKFHNGEFKLNKRNELYKLNVSVVY